LPRCSACVFLLQALSAGLPLPRPLPGLIPAGLISHVSTGVTDVARRRLTFPRGPPLF